MDPVVRALADAKRCGGTFFGGSAAFVPHSGAWDRRSAVKMEPKSLSLAQDSPEPKERVQQQQQRRRRQRQRQRPGHPKPGGSIKQPEAMLRRLRMARFSQRRSQTKLYAGSHNQAQL